MSHPPFRHWPARDRPEIGWPDGARTAVWIGVNVEHYAWGVPSISIVGHTAGLVPDPANEGWRDYGVRSGIWRVFEALERHGFPGSGLINSEVCRLHPEIVEEGRRQGWAWLAHGRVNSEKQAEIEPGEERERIAEMVAVIRAATGRAPRGWLGPGLTETTETPRLLAEAGFTYVCDWCNDDQPYPLDVAGMISVPYTVELNDIPWFVDRGAPARDYAGALVDGFDRLHAEGGKVMAIPLHPFLVGQPHRIGHLERALAHIAAQDGVWRATSDDIAAWYLEHHHDAALAAVDARERLLRRHRA